MVQGREKRREHRKKNHGRKKLRQGRYLFDINAGAKRDIAPSHCCPSFFFFPFFLLFIFICCLFLSSYLVPTLCLLMQYTFIQVSLDEGNGDTQHSLNNALGLDCSRHGPNACQSMLAPPSTELARLTCWTRRELSSSPITWICSKFEFKSPSISKYIIPN